MFLIILLLCLLVMLEAKRYDNHALFRGTPSKDTHLQFLLSMVEKGYDVNFWTDPNSSRKPVEFLLAPENITLFLYEAKNMKMPVVLLQDNIQRLIDKEEQSRRSMESMHWDNYIRLDVIYKWLIDLANNNSREMLVQSIGNTIEGREILVVTIILKGSLRRSKVIIEGGIHAREWISPAFVTYAINEIINSKTSSNALLREIANVYEWHFVPVLNPDGYDYSYRHDRFWRKNRNHPGVDLNRNFGYLFSDCYNPFSETYCGSSAFSEKETFAWKKYVNFHATNLEYYFSIHSYGQFIIIPYGHTAAILDNYNEVHAIARAAANVIHSKWKTGYTIGTAVECVSYTLRGSSCDWVKNTFKIPYAVTFELRDRGRHGFVLPTEQIKPTVEETLAGILSFVQPNARPFHEIKKSYEEYVVQFDQIRGLSRSFLVVGRKYLVFSIVFSKILL